MPRVEIKELPKQPAKAKGLRLSKVVFGEGVLGLGADNFPDYLLNSELLSILSRNEVIYHRVIDLWNIGKQNEKIMQTASEKRRYGKITSAEDCPTVASLDREATIDESNLDLFQYLKRNYTFGKPGVFSPSFSLPF